MNSAISIKSWKTIGNPNCFFVIALILTGFFAVNFPADARTITMGESSVLSGDDSGNGNLLLAQSCVLAQPGTVISLSFYVETAAGSLVLAIYDQDDVTGGPGQLLAFTQPFTPEQSNQWYTEPVNSPVNLNPGNYWLAYSPSSDALSFKGSSSGSARYYSRSYDGTFPSTFSLSATALSGHWSFCATLTNSDTTTPPPDLRSWPNATNTGVRSKATLTPWNPEPIVDGMTIEGKDISEGLDFSANNVTIRNCKIHTSDGFFGILLRSGTNVVVEDCEIYDTSDNGGYTGFAGDNMTIRRCNFYNWENGGSAGSNTTVQDCYIHDPGHRPGAHTDGIEWGGGSNVILRHNRIAIRDETSCINIGGQSGVISHIQVLNNLFFGGTYSLALEGRQGITMHDVTVVENVWVKNSYQHGPFAIEQVPASDIAWWNNVLDDGTPVISGLPSNSLYLELKQISLLNHMASFHINGTFGGLFYELLSKEDLASTNDWNVQGKPVFCAPGQDWTVVTLSLSNQTEGKLFFKAKSK